jgi:hypothetical protein
MIVKIFAALALVLILISVLIGQLRPAIVDKESSIKAEKYFLMMLICAFSGYAFLLAGLFIRIYEL